MNRPMSLCGVTAEVFLGLNYWMKQVLLNMFPKPTENSWEICFTLKPCLVLISDAESVELRSLGPGKSSHGLRLCINLSSQGDSNIAHHRSQHHWRFNMWDSVSFYTWRNWNTRSIKSGSAISIFERLQENKFLWPITLTIRLRDFRHNQWVFLSFSDSSLERRPFRD